MNDATGGKPDHAQRKIDLLMEEYRALYSLVTFRMTSLDRRVPIATAALATFLGSVSAIPSASQSIFLVGLPLAQVWLVRTTINHARSFEDVLRRIDEIERRANELAGEELLVFQSRHPSSGKATGGRTGMETVWTVYTTSLLMLGACAYLAAQHTDDLRVVGGYAGACGVIAAYLTALVLRLRRYRYVKGRWRGALQTRWGRSRAARPGPTTRGRRRPGDDHQRDAPWPSSGPSAGGTASGHRTAGTEAGTTAAPSGPHPC